MTEHRMSCKRCSIGTSAEDHNVYQVQQILKNDIIDETQSSHSTDSAESITKKGTRTSTKKSLFATLIKKKHTGTPKMKITKKVETLSTIRFGTESASSDQELARYQLSTEMTHTPASKSSCLKKQKRGFFKKIIKSNDSCINPTKKNKYCDDSQSSEKITLSRNKLIPTAYMPKHNLKLISGMHELYAILHNLHHSQQHVVFLLKKYIVDKNVQQQLLSASFEFFALQYDSKCHVNVLADKMWFQQVETYKVQDYNLQKRLSFLVQTNRALEMQIENLSRQWEKLASRKSAYPKRFLHMKSFGKIYAKLLIENNKKLQKKLIALTGIISDFEEELAKIQHQKDVLEDEARNFRSQIFHLEGELEKQEHDKQLERTQLEVQINHQHGAISETASSVQLIFQDIQDFKYQLEEYSITIVGPQIQMEKPCLPEIIYHLRACIAQLLLTMVTAYRNISVVAQDVTKLRNTNARLQENLQKSTNELNTLSKKIGSSESLDGIALEKQCRKLEQELISLNGKLENMASQNSILQEEMSLKKRTLSETQISMNDLMVQNQSLGSQIDELVQTTSQIEEENVGKEFHSTQDKLEYLRLRFNQIVADEKHLTERCNTLDEENQNLQQVQQAYQQDLTTLQDGLAILSTENETIKKQLATEHQTVTTLQNERLKYLEEKNILKTIFHHLKSEVSRIQQLEGAVADMSKETNRLSLVAEFNKQLGEQLKSEVEVKENTIIELRQSLEKLSHIQLDNDKEKMTLCAQLSDVVSVKDKLSDCLEMELKKNIRLDESKKKLETSTKSQLKIFEEMQRNERSALKELLKDFKSLIKQRDCLVIMQEESKKKHKELEKQYYELRKQHEEMLTEVNKKEEEVKRLVDRIDYQEEQYRQQEGNYSTNISRYEKTTRKLEKLLGQLRNEKGDLENSNMFLKDNMQKLQSELNEAKDQMSVAENQIISKTTEAATLNSQLTSYKNELQILRQEHGKVVLELEYAKKMTERQSSEFKETICGYNNKESMYQESQSTLRCQEQEINNLNRLIVEKESEIKRLEQECKHLTKQNEDQMKIMIGYENHLVMLQDAEDARLKIERELGDVKLEHKSTNLELDNALRENETLKNELQSLHVRNEKERTYFKKQTNEIISEYSEQKVNIEEEISSISDQLRSVTENLRTEKSRFDELSDAYDDLKLKHTQLKEQLKSEASGHQETNRKFEKINMFMNTIAAEKDNLQQQVHLMLLEINEEREASQHLANENKTLQMILEQGRQEYSNLLKNNTALEEELTKMKVEMQMTASIKDSSKGEVDKAVAQLEIKNQELKLAKDAIESLKREVSDSQKRLFDLKEEFFKLQQHVTAIEFKNCELTLQLHESQGKLQTERNLFKELKEPKQGADRTFRPAPSECGELFFNQN